MFKGSHVLLYRDFHPTVGFTENLFLKRFELSSQQVKCADSLIFYPFSHATTLATINFLIFIPLKLPAKILASTYDFAVNIVMLINITITINKTHNIHDLIYAASAYDSVNIIMVIKHVT